MTKTLNFTVSQTRQIVVCLVSTASDTKDTQPKILFSGKRILTFAFLLVCAIDISNHYKRTIEWSRKKSTQKDNFRCLFVWCVFSVYNNMRHKTQNKYQIFFINHYFSGNIYMFFCLQNIKQIHNYYIHFLPLNSSWS